MDLRLLGPLEVRSDGAVLELPGASERALLALLATAPGRPFSKTHLIDALWGDALPSNPDNALQVRVSKLRRVVGPAIVTRPPGYALDIDPEAVDLVRFERLVGEQRFAQALELWLGEPLAEFEDAEWAEAVRRRLNELRVVAIEEDIELRLARGEHVALVAELEGLVAAFPLRERLRGQLMVALYRCGRAPEALATYTQLRDTLDEELGVEPSAALRELETDILREHPRLAAPAGTEPAKWNVPALRKPVLGREETVAQVAAALSDNALVTLVGPGGVGKTTLALAAAHALADDFADGVVFVPLSRAVDGQVADAVAEALGAADPDARSISRVVASWLATRRLLLVLDNCEHLVDPCAAFVDEVLAASRGGLRIIATSREALAVPGEIQIPVPPLDEGASARLFLQRARSIRPDLPQGEDDDDVRRICERLDGLPLAIELAAARVNTLELPEIAARLEDRFGFLTTGPRTAEARQRTLQATVEWSHELLLPEEQVLFRRLAVFQGGWNLDAAAAVCGDPADADMLDLLGRLVDRSLVVAEGGRFRMLETIRAYAARVLDTHGEHPALAQRHAQFFTALAEEAEPALRGPRQAEWLERLRAEDANLRLAMLWAREQRDGALALRLGGALGWYWYVGRQAEGRTYLDDVLRLDGGSDDARAGALQAQSLLLRPVGCIVHPQADAAAAADRSAALFQASGDPVRAAISSLLVAVEGVAAPDPAEAIALVHTARASLGGDANQWGRALADFVEMEIRLQHGEVDAALLLGQAASDAFTEVDDAWGRSAVLLHLGYGLRVAGRVDEAEPVLERAVTLSREAGLPNNLARSLCELGEAALHRADPDGALPWFAQARQVATELGNDTLLALAALGEGRASLLHGDTAAAEARLHEALELSERAAFANGVARAQAALAELTTTS